ncbi:hypothetical protein HYT84_00705 [Candidatus Micrarchaeota archaeon]|nr:hypothetical protein [Candidatus Micrarchaeota archaeon]
MVSLNEYIDSLRLLVGNDVLLAISILLLGIITSRFLHYFIQKKIKKLVENTKTDVDDAIVNVLERTLEDAVILVAVYLAIFSIQLFNPHMDIITSLFFVIGVLLVANAIQKLVSSFIPRWIQVAHKDHEKSPAINKPRIERYRIFIGPPCYFGLFSDRGNSNYRSSWYWWFGRRPSTSG